MSKNNQNYKSDNNCILAKNGTTLKLCRSHFIPNGVKAIGIGAFSGCTSLQSIEIPDSVKYIEKAAFNRCTSLQSIEIPNSITSIGDNAFAYCSSLQSIEIHDSVIEIGECAFFACISLQSITIVTQAKEPDLSRERLGYLLQALSEYSKVISLRVPIGCGYAYRHYPAFEGKFQKIIADIDV